MLQMWKSDQNIILENSTKNCNIGYFINVLFGKPERAHTSVTALHTRVCMLGDLFSGFVSTDHLILVCASIDYQRQATHRWYKFNMDIA